MVEQDRLAASVPQRDEEEVTVSSDGLRTEQHRGAPSTHLRIVGTGAARRVRHVAGRELPPCWWEQHVSRRHAPLVRAKPAVFLGTVVTALVAARIDGLAA